MRIHSFAETRPRAGSTRAVRRSSRRWVAGIAGMCSLLCLGATAGTAPAGTTTATGGSITLDNGHISIPKADVGNVDLRSLPLGDQQDSTTPQKGKIELCNTGQLQPANDSTVFPWVHGTTWDLTQKVFVSGAVAWPAATFENKVQGSTRVLSGNDLPVGHTTGTFPVTSTDAAAPYRPNPGSIAASSFTLRLPAAPKVAAQPSCMGGDVGVTTDGVALLNGFDANGRDAAAQEVQDACFGHPNRAGYHRHAIPLCLLNDSGTGHSPLLGYALDGFGIYGPRGDHGKVLTTDKLDVCHGTTDTITWNGKKVRMYHYVFTWQFPYTLGCFRGTPATRAIFGGGRAGGAPTPGSAGGGPPAS
jgi:YHYH protein